MDIVGTRADGNIPTYQEARTTANGSRAGIFFRSWGQAERHVRRDRNLLDWGRPPAARPGTNRHVEPVRTSFCQPLHTRETCHAPSPSFDPGRAPAGPVSVGVGRLGRL